MEYLIGAVAAALLVGLVILGRNLDNIYGKYCDRKKEKEIEKRA